MKHQPEKRQLLSNNGIELSLRRFTAQLDALAKRIKEILEEECNTHAIKVSSITYRVKEADSVFNKLERKDELRNVLDLVGIRVNYLFTDDTEKLIEILNRCFIVESCDRKMGDSSGYKAIHFVVRIRDDSKELKDRKLKGLRCEIQLRTLLQSAWAEISHTLFYKKRIIMDDGIDNKLLELSTKLSGVDAAFCELRKMANNQTSRFVGPYPRPPKSLLSNVINRDSLERYSIIRISPMGIDDFEFYPGQAEWVIKRFNKVNLRLIEDIHNAVRSWDKVLKDYINMVWNSPGRIAQLTIICFALELNGWGLEFNWGKIALHFLRDRLDKPPIYEETKIVEGMMVREIKPEAEERAKND
jgi:ppGpp synthetase/RelA/SpoT-type nucleotidyltranferase